MSEARYAVMINPSLLDSRYTTTKDLACPVGGNDSTSRNSPYDMQPICLEAGDHVEIEGSKISGVICENVGDPMCLG